MDTAVDERTGIAASVLFYVQVPRVGVWNSTSKHWMINFGMWMWVGYDHGSTTVTGGEIDADACAEGEGILDLDPEARANCDSPILLDPQRNGYDLTSREDGVWFDIDADGTPELVSWTQADTDDAWLAMDRNGNGRIDDGSELFGNHTPAYPNQTRLTSGNGFKALTFLQGPDFGPSYGDDLVDARDSMYFRLLLWRDRNHNGISEPPELQPAHQAGLVSISTNYHESRRRDRYGNEFRQRAEVRWRARNRIVSGKAFDVWLVTR